MNSCTIMSALESSYWRKINVKILEKFKLTANPLYFFIFMFINIYKYQCKFSYEKRNLQTIWHNRPIYYAIYLEGKY